MVQSILKRCGASEGAIGETNIDHQALRTEPTKMNFVDLVFDIVTATMMRSTFIMLPTFISPPVRSYQAMLNPVGPLRPRVLVVDDELAKLDTALGRAVESLAAALEARNIEVLKAISFEDGQAIVVSDASLRAVLLDWNLGINSEGTHAQATALLHKLPRAA